MKTPLLCCLGLLALTSHAELSIVEMDPPPGATNVCADTLLTLTFNKEVQIRQRGVVQVMRVRDGRVLDRIDLMQPVHTNLYGTKVLRYEPVRGYSNIVVIQLHARVLEPDTTCSVQLDAGFIESLSGEVPAVKPWEFTTRSTLAKAKTNLVVAPKSLGDFCTLQGAVDYIPEDNFTPTEVRILNGTYDAIAYLGPGRNRIRITGEDRKKTILAGRNNDRLNGGRMMRPFISVDADDVTIENLTVRNTTPYKGSQAEALRMDGQRCIVRNCDFYSYQDTLLLGGRIYVRDCYVEGDVDFIWGHGTTFFDRCELKAVHDGYYITSRNPDDLFGFVFNECKLTAGPETKKCWLARIETGRFPFSAVAFINCEMGPHIPAEGWLITGTDTNRLRFFEYRTRTLKGEPMDVSKRHPASRQISSAEAAELSNPNKVLAHREAWTPNP